MVLTLLPSLAPRSTHLIMFFRWEHTSACGSLDTLRVFGVSVSIILPGLGMAAGAVSSWGTLTRGRAKGLEGLAWLISGPCQNAAGLKGQTCNAECFARAYTAAIPQQSSSCDYKIPPASCSKICPW